MPLAIDILENVGQGTGGMDLDSDLLRVSRGNYVRGLNIRRVSNEGQTSYAYENILGNELAWVMPTVTRQNKILRIFLSVAVSTTINLTIRDRNGQVATTFSFTSTNINTGLFDLSNAILSALAATNNTVITTSTVVDATNGYLDVEITTILGKEWFITGQYGTLQNVQIFTMQEAVDTSIAGPMKIIGGKKLVGDLFIYSTTQNNLPSQIDIFFVGGTAGNPYIITTTQPHGLTGGEEITINGLTIATDANGTWMVLNVISTTQFTISQNYTANDGAGGILTVNTHGIGEIGVAVYDDNTGGSTYTTLVRSRKFNFVSPKQIDCYHEENNIKFSLYWTDDYNVPRVLYYKGPFVTNGAITEFNPLGQYHYDTLEQETRLFLKNTAIRLTFSRQYQTGGGGGVLSGNNRYAIRLVTESGVTTEPTVLTNPINTYSADFGGDIDLVEGNAPVVNTPKINELLITGILPGLFKFVELIVVNYQGGSFVSSLVRRDLLTQETTQTIRHNGAEILEPFDTGELLLENTAVSTAKNIDGLENTLILSNLTSPIDADLSVWARQIKYRLKQKGLSTIGDLFSSPGVGEYQDFNNVVQFVGYMHNETYRLGVEVQYRDTGIWSSAFFVADITINTDTTSPDGQRLGGLPGFNLTDNSINNPHVIVAFIQPTNLLYDFILADGRRVRDVISAVRFVRADVIPEVLACGMIHIGVKGTLPPSQGNAQTNIFSYPGYCGLTGTYPQFFLSGATTQLGTKTAFRNFGCLYSPDVFLGGNSISFLAGMKLKVMGKPQDGNGRAFWAGSGGFGIQNEFIDYTGWFANSFLFNEFTIDALQQVSRAGSVSMAGQTYQLFGPLFNSPPNTAPDQWEDQKGIVLHTTTPITGNNINFDNGHYYAQIFRAIATLDPFGKYGDPRLTKYVATGHYAAVDESSSSSDTHDVFGGDTFIQRTYLHHRYKNTIATPQNTTGYGGGYSFYSQNRINSQMRSGTGGVYPISQDSATFPFKIGNWLETLTNEDFSYNHGYDIRNQIQIDPAFDITAEQQTDLPTRFIYSDVKPQNSLVDNYRNFPPLNFHDANNNYGEVMHHANVNNKLLAWQTDAFSDMRFNPIAALSTAEGSEVITGTGAKMSKPQDVISTYGTLNKWSVKLWLSAGGKDVAGWVTNNKSIARYGYDGTVIISDREHIKSFLANNLTWAQLYDTPAHGEGIHGVYDARFHDVIWTVRGRKNVQTWSASFGYIIGAEVFVAGGSTFEQTGDIFISLINNNAGNDPVTSPTAWRKVSHADGRYWNEYSLVWNELTNKFQAFYSFKPKIMLEWNNNFISPSPRTEKNIYLHNRLKYCSWYQDGVAVQEEDGYIDMLLNKEPEQVKHFLASMFNSELPPFKVECTTKQHKTFMVASDFEREVDVFFSAIKNDILTSSTGQANDEDTGNIFGNYVIVRLYFEKLIYQKVVSAVIKYVPTFRSYRT